MGFILLLIGSGSAYTPLIGHHGVAPSLPVVQRLPSPAGSPEGIFVSGPWGVQGATGSASEQALGYGSVPGMVGLDQRANGATWIVAALLVGVVAGRFSAHARNGPSARRPALA